MLTSLLATSDFARPVALLSALAESKLILDSSLSLEDRQQIAIQATIARLL